MNIIAMAAAVIFSCSAAPNESSVLDATISDAPRQTHAVSEAYGKSNIGAVILSILKIKVAAKWKGRAFLCLKNGNTCEADVEIGIGKSVSREDVPHGEGLPEGSLPAILLTIDGEPWHGGGTELGERTFVVGNDWNPLDPDHPIDDGTTIFFPTQTPIWIDDLGGYLVGYFVGD